MHIHIHTGKFSTGKSLEEEHLALQQNQLSIAQKAKMQKKASIAHTSAQRKQRNHTSQSDHSDDLGQSDRTDVHATKGKKFTKTKPLAGVSKGKTTAASRHKDALADSHHQISDDDVDKSQQTHAAKSARNSAVTTATNACNSVPLTGSDVEPHTRAPDAAPPLATSSGDVVNAVKHDIPITGSDVEPHMRASTLTTSSEDVVNVVKNGEPLTGSDVEPHMRAPTLTTSSEDVVNVVMNGVPLARDNTHARHDTHARDDTHALDNSSSDVSLVWRQQDIVVQARESYQRSWHASSIDEEYDPSSEHVHEPHTDADEDEHVVRKGIVHDHDHDHDHGHDDMSILEARESDGQHSETPIHNEYTRENQHPDSGSERSLSVVNSHGHHEGAKAGHADPVSLENSHVSDSTGSTGDHSVQENQKYSRPDSEFVRPLQVRAGSEFLWPSNTETLQGRGNELQAWSDVADANAGMEFAFLCR
jgi:hypothetical protein